MRESAERKYEENDTSVAITAWIFFDEKLACRGCMQFMTGKNNLNLKEEAKDLSVHFVSSKAD